MVMLGGGGEFDGQRNWGDIKRPTADGVVQGLQADYRLG